MALEFLGTWSVPVERHHFDADSRVLDGSTQLFHCGGGAGPRLDERQHVARDACVFFVHVLGTALEGGTACVGH